MSSTELVPSVSIANLVNQRAAVLDKITAAVQLLREASTMAGAAHLGMPRMMISNEYSRGGYNERDLCAARLRANATDGKTWDHEQSEIADVAKMIRLGVDSSGWQYLMHESGMRSLMDATARKDWDKAISDGQIPELTEANIRSTFSMLHDSRGEIFERGVVACFKGLAWDYKTNLPQKFGKRIVMNYLTGYHGHEKAAQLDDLVRVFSLLDGKPEPDHRTGMYSLIGYGNNVRTIETEYMTVKTFKNSNGHITFKRLDLVESMNKIIAKHYPGALPAPK